MFRQKRKNLKKPIVGKPRGDVQLHWKASYHKSKIYILKNSVRGKKNNQKFFKISQRLFAVQRRFFFLEETQSSQVCLLSCFGGVFKRK